MPLPSTSSRDSNLDFHDDHDNNNKLINLIVGVYIPIIRIPSENRSSQKKMDHLRTIHFQGRFVSFRESITYKYPGCVKPCKSRDKLYPLTGFLARFLVAINRYQFFMATNQLIKTAIRQRWQKKRSLLRTSVKPNTSLPRKNGPFDWKIRTFPILKMGKLYQPTKIMKSEIPKLVGGWTNPFEKYVRQIGNLHPTRDEHFTKNFELPPPFKGVVTFLML